MIHDSFELFMIRDDPYNNPDDILKFFLNFYENDAILS